MRERVKTTTAFGAFVEIMPGTEGLVHISEMRTARTEKTEDVVKKGDRVKVKLIDRDERGRLRLSMKALLPRPEGMPEPEPGSGNGGSTAASVRGARAVIAAAAAVRAVAAESVRAASERSSGPHRG